jgi:polygalacturonase
VTLHLETGAVLVASRDESHYLRGEGEQAPVLIRGHQARRIAITGRGVIDGQARQIMAEPEGTDSFIENETRIAREAGIDMKRPVTVKPNPCLVFLTECEDVLIEDASFLNSAFWSVHLGSSERIQIRNARIETSTEMGVNADGLDIDGCRDVRATGCTISTGDDAICLKSTRHSGGRDCTDIVVTACVLRSTSCALKIGTETHGNFRRIVFSDCVIRNTNRGLGIFVRDGGEVSDVLFSDIVMECGRKHYNWWGDGDPLRFVVLKRGPESRVGSIRRVTVSNVIATAQGTSLIAGYPSGDTISGITLRDVRITMEAEATADKRSTNALNMRDAKDITLDALAVRWDPSNGVEPAWRQALVAERVEGLQTRGCSLDPPPRR